MQCCSNYRGLKVISHSTKLWESNRDWTERKRYRSVNTVCLYAKKEHCIACSESADEEV